MPVFFCSNDHDPEHMLPSGIVARCPVCGAVLEIPGEFPLQYSKCRRSRRVYVPRFPDEKLLS